jgi:alanine-glyoxylate transaminase/(R)-3-amino-2-methylpropionate-pyruvate transaminase
MMAIELVKNRDSREPDPQTMLRLFEKTREFGLVASKSGAYRNVLRICPPLCMQMDDVRFFADAINKSFDSL